MPRPALTRGKNLLRHALLAAALLAGARAAATTAPLRVVAFGDSTTAARENLEVYPTLLERRLREESGLAVEVVNAGVRGNTTRDAAKRLEADVLARRPRLVIIQFGINDATVDVWKTPPETQPRVGREEYRSNLVAFVRRCREAGAGVVLMTPNSLRWSERTLKMYGHPPYNPADPDGLNLNLRDYARIMREVAAETATPLVDVMEAHDNARLRGAPEMTTDGVHPDQRGQQLVCDLLFALLRSTPGLLPGRSAESPATQKQS